MLPPPIRRATGGLAATLPALLCLGVAGAVLLAGCPADKKCAGGETSCSGACFDLQTSTLSCGACLHACPRGAACAAGVCACPAGLSVCGNACVDEQTSAAHCGGCDQPCGTGVCSAGTCDCTGSAACAVSPGDGKVRCADTQGDPANCGTCGHACRAGESCQAGTCACLSPHTDCGADGCVNLLTDAGHCSGTATCPGVACPATATCQAGQCTCPAGTTLCGGACVNLATDPLHCGTTCLNAVACATHGTCTAGVCGCPAGLGTQCGTSPTSPGVCVDVTSDEANCGTCGTACASGKVCTSSKCCGAGQVVCGAAAGAACCTGDGCCSGGACQATHDTGLGQTFYDCVPRDTYNRTEAIAAANRWSPTGGSDFEILECGTGCYCRSAGGVSATWCYVGAIPTLVGLVHLNANDASCHCPSNASIDKTWH
jgi:hypothetical protein